MWHIGTDAAICLEDSITLFHTEFDLLSFPLTYFHTVKPEIYSEWFTLFFQCSNPEGFQSLQKHRVKNSVISN